MQPSENIGHRWASDFSVEPSEVQAEFDAEAAEYEQHLKDWDYRVPEDSAKILTEYVPRSARVLEAGCGTGLVGAALYVLGYRDLHGCDLSSAMLELAKSKGIYKQLLQADLCQRLPYEDDDFDATTCLATLSFIEDAEPTFREFCRVTRMSVGVKRLVKDHPEVKKDQSLVADLKDSTKQIEALIHQTEELADSFERGRSEMVHLAGIGAMVEFMAHELNRATERALDTLSSRGLKGLSPKQQPLGRMVEQMPRQRTDVTSSRGWPGSPTIR